MGWRTRHRARAVTLALVFAVLGTLGAATSAQAHWPTHGDATATTRAWLRADRAQYNIRVYDFQLSSYAYGEHSRIVYGKAWEDRNPSALSEAWVCDLEVRVQHDSVVQVYQYGCSRSYGA